jgi:hypothetical protein
MNKVQKTFKVQTSSYPFSEVYPDLLYEKIKAQMDFGR